MNAAEGALLSACSGPEMQAPPKAQPGFVSARCERGPDGVAPEKPGVAHTRSRMGVAPRLDDEETESNTIWIVYISGTQLWLRRHHIAFTHG